MKKIDCFRRVLLIIAGLVVMTMGCSKSIPVSYQTGSNISVNIVRPTVGRTMKDIKIGIARFKDLRPLVKQDKPKTESYITPDANVGITYQGREFFPVKNMIQEILVNEFKNAGFNAKPIDEVLSNESKQDIQMAGKKNGVDYVIGGDIVDFQFFYQSRWTANLQSDVSLNIFLGKVQENKMLLNTSFTEKNEKNFFWEGGEMLEITAERLINTIFKGVVMQVIQNVAEKLRRVTTTLTSEESLLLKKAGVSDEKISEMQNKDGVAAPAPKLNPFDWNEDGKKDIISGSDSGKVYVYLNKGTNQQPEFDMANEIFNVKVEDGESTPYVVDWNEDGKNDILVGQKGGEVFIFVNGENNKEPSFGKGIKLNDGDLDVGSSSSPAMVDWNNDGKKDLVLGNGGGKVFVFLNIGYEQNPRFSSSDGIKTDIKVAGMATPFIVDWNNDGKFDVVSGSSDGKVYIFINEGDSKNPKFGKPQLLQVNNKELKLPGPTSVIALDWDDDGRADLLVSNKEKDKIGMYLLLNTGTKEKPEFKELKPVKGKFRDDTVL